MILTLQIRFRTHSGQSLFVVNDHARFGNGDPARGVPLQYVGNELWQTMLDLPPGAADSLRGYRYALREQDGSFAQDAGNDRYLPDELSAHESLCVVDSWNHPGYYENVFYTDPFRKVLLRSCHDDFAAAPAASPTHTFRVRAPLLTAGQTLCLLGNTEALGNWDIRRAVLMSRSGEDAFLSVAVDLASSSFPVSYKYGVYDLNTHEFIRWEDGPDRVLHSTSAIAQQACVNDCSVRLPVTWWKGAGVAIPVFSLRTRDSLGVGEFRDLIPLVDWCRQTGLKLIQVLPVNDTISNHTWTDSYPYAAISAFALHPLYLNIGQVAGEAGRPLLKSLNRETKRLNSLPAVDYEEALRVKLKFLRKLYSQQGASTLGSEDFQAFFAQNGDWLIPYAAFCVLRDRYGTPDASQWPAHRAHRSDEITNLSAPGSPAHEEIGFHYFLQYHLHLQLREAAEYAHRHGIILKGDIPIGVARCSADTWQQPELYHLDMQAGAPPDAFAVKGQNWGFPTYNWSRMKEDGFAWWKARFEQMSCYFDAFRIDHILGFFRIWSVPLHAVEGILGYFVPALPVRTAEFAERGIPFDRERFTRPYITDRVLSAVFGGDADYVRGHFLVPAASDRYALKAEFATQRQVEDYFASLEASERNGKLRLGLFDLLSNVLLLEVNGPDEFQFRFAIESTTSFQDLDPQVQRRLTELYIDAFFRRQDGFWMHEALQKLPALKRVTNMLVCGEDLGLVPACVPEVMQQLGLLSLEIQRMPKRQGQDFFNPKDAPYLSVVTPSTHDMSTIRGWWEEDPAVTQRFYTSELGQAGEAPAECTAAINEVIVRQHLASPAMWSIFQLQDLLGTSEELRRPDPTEERINVPANPRNYWRYRMHCDLETLLAARDFNLQLKSWILHSGR